MKFCIIISVLFVSLSCFAQDSSWPAMADVTIQLVKDEATGYDLEVPIFGEKAKALDGKEVVLPGYMVPLQEMLSQNYFVISALPYNMCFFCGSAGPETVAEVNTSYDVKYTSKKIRIKGRLKLNYDEPEHLMYIITNAKLIEE